jgi:hypothetical protein
MTGFIIVCARLASNNRVLKGGRKGNEDTSLSGKRSLKATITHLSILFINCSDVGGN